MKAQKLPPGLRGDGWSWLTASRVLDLACVTLSSVSLTAGLGGDMLVAQAGAGRQEKSQVHGG